MLRKNRGQLLPTKVARHLVDDPAGLWRHLAMRLPDGRAEPERQAGILYLLTVAAGRPQDDALLAVGMSILGWTVDGFRPITDISAFSAARPTWWVFRWLALVPDGIPRNTADAGPTEQGRRLARAALLGESGPTSAPGPAPPEKAQQAVQLLVQLQEITPPIWRRLVVPASLTLRRLHGVIQTVMGWEDYHLHVFDINGVRYGDIEDFDGTLGDEDSFSVGEAAAAVREFTYEYDFGDGWTHDIRVEQVMASVGVGTPHLLGGARACPPEDCGGPWGYGHLLEVLADAEHAEHAQLLAWLGSGFDAEAFAPTARNADLEVVDRHTRQRRTGPR